VRARAVAVCGMSSFRGRSFAREDLRVGSQVVGGNQLLSGRIGRVKDITGQGSNRRYFVEWEDGDNYGMEGREWSCYPKRSLRQHVEGRDLAPAPRRGVRQRAVSSHAAGGKRGRGNGTFAPESDGSGSSETDGGDGSSASESSSEDDDVVQGNEEDDDADGQEDAAAAPGNDGRGHRHQRPAPSIVMHQPPQQFEEDSTIYLEKKVRGQLVDHITWTCRGDVPEALEQQRYNGRCRLQWQLLNLRADDDKREVDYWKLMYPPLALNEQLALTNANIAQWNSDHADAPPVALAEKWEIVRVKGLRLAMSLQPVKRPLKWYWQKDADSDEVLIPPNFGERYGMSRDRFEKLEQHTQYCPRPPAGADVDPWWPVRGLVAAFNQRRNHCISPGLFVTEDESGSWWFGKNAKKLPAFLQDGACPHVTYMKKKPKKHFIEFKNICDVDSGIMLQLELQEGGDVMANKPYSRQYAPHVAWSLRLLAGAGLLMSWRVVIADAAFGSVSAVKALLKHGMLAMMIVKTAHTLYPITEFRLWASTKDPKHNVDDRGSRLVYTANVSVRGAGADNDVSHRIAAIAFMHQNVRTIVSSYGRCGDGNPLQEERKMLHPDPDNVGHHRVVTAWRDIPCPENVAEMIHGFGAIDQHNDLRQGILRMEYQHRTPHWWKRIATTLDGMHFTDAYRAYCWDKCMNGDGSAPSDLIDFCSRLARQLIFNDWKPSAAIHERRRAENAAQQRQHTLAQACKLPGRSWFNDAQEYQDKARGRCRICTKKASHYCEACSTGLEDRRQKMSIFWCCQKDGSCFAQHLQDVVALN
jgi:hypothetical protein